jgi:hypothetical protein
LADDFPVISVIGLKIFTCADVILNGQLSMSSCRWLVLVLGVIENDLPLEVVGVLASAA